MESIAALNERRAALDFTQSSVADAMGVSAPVLSRAVRGNPTQEFLDRYSDALDELSRKTTPQQIADIARPIATKHFVDELYLFGSMARGEGTAHSDVDLIYRFSPEANPPIDSWALRDDLEQAFGRNVDLVRKDYFTTPLSDRLAETQRILFVNSVTSKPMFRII
ncbi:nucleotidyltransferase domain-containing protein [Bifidobacterium eulemuris]|uniref:Nucleotidyltransferase domain-containing protein n=1 Tax=Bifidobacterium eulemuris TaxID=1765219 RepID=A0A261GCF5_9BIFI|nr:nucleotidyltransferase domain-containing protein [Bifidobacterium eulemuris]OZG69107.1 nucleotidyltransferase family protein [Bifidobacterium eulemuris]QOL31374.1 nucleotidyltransferase domain-containing protein [Bifidobacterium eulemuris]